MPREHTAFDTDKDLKDLYTNIVDSIGDKEFISYDRLQEYMEKHLPDLSGQEILINMLAERGVKTTPEEDENLIDFEIEEEDLDVITESRLEEQLHHLLRLPR